MLSEFANADPDLASTANSAATTDRVDVNTKCPSCL